MSKIVNEFKLCITGLPDRIIGKPRNLSVDIYIKINCEINIKVNTTVIFTNLTFIILI